MLNDFLGLIWRNSDDKAVTAAKELFANAEAQLYGQRLLASKDLNNQVFVMCGDAPRNAPDENCWASTDGDWSLVSGYIKPRNGDASDSRLDARLVHQSLSEYGDGAPTRWRGRYSGCVWDAEAQRLTAIRDRIGHEPLYYVYCAEYFAFSTSFKALRTLIGQTATLDDVAVVDFLALIEIDQRQTLIREIRRLPPAHILSLDVDFKLDILRYWSLRECSMQSFLDAETCYEKFRRVVITTLEDESERSETPGLMLSGGLDSSSLGAAFFQTARGQSGTLSAFGSSSSAIISGTEQSDDELQFMQALANRYPRLDLTIIKPEGWLFGNLAGIVDQLGFPPIDPYHYEMTSLVSTAKAAGCDLLITGLGGDFFASSKVSDFYSSLFFRGGFSAIFKQATAERGRLNLKKILRLYLGQIVKPSLRQYYIRWNPFPMRSRFLPFPLSGLALKPDMVRKTGLRSRIFQTLNATHRIYNDPISASADMLEGGIVPRILEYTSAFSRAYGLKLCNPLLDEQVIEFIVTTPLIYRRRGALLRSMLRLAFKPLLPSKIADRTTKGNFSIDAMKRFQPIAIEQEIKTLNASPELNRYIVVSRLKQQIIPRDSSSPLNPSQTIPFFFVLALNRICTSIQPM